MQQTLSVKEIALKLPENPGVYTFYDVEATLLYVGKAKNLKNRVNSYFNQSRTHNRKTQILVSQIDHIEFTVVNSEYDALLLENNLIKNHQPKYNILLKDDKTYPYVCVSKERFPKVFPTRQMRPGEGKYYGPFTNIKAMNTILELIRELYPQRNCHLNLSAANIQAQKFKVCLEYHLGNCLGPCEGLQSEEEYMQAMEQVHLILRGNLNQAKQFFKQKMMECAEQLQFEHAEEYKLKLKRIENYQSKSLVVNPKLRDVDVFSIISDEKIAYVNYLKVKDGAIVYTKTSDVKKKLDESDEEIINLLALDWRTETESEASELICNVPLDESFPGATFVQPKIGDKKKLLELSLKNVFYYKKDREKRVAAQSQKMATLGGVEELQKVLKLKNPPVHIECFDNSNIQGSNPVASMVHFKNGRPFKQEYRKFNIKTVEGPDDFSSMREIVFRRYRRLLEEKKALPDLIVIDGGKGQLSAACEALHELKIYGQIPIIGIAKRLEEIYVPEDPIPLHIAKKSPALTLIQRVRDEAHRFAITFHRDKRSKGSLKSELEDIKGIGPATIQKLLKHFKSVRNIRESSANEIYKLVGKSKGELVVKHLESKKESLN